MPDVLDMDELRKKTVEKRTRWLVWIESLVILGLLVFYSNEYNTNQYFRDWVGKTLGPLGFFLNGTLAGLYAGALLGFFLADYLRKRSEQQIVRSVQKTKNL